MYPNPREGWAELGRVVGIGVVVFSLSFSPSFCLLALFLPKKYIYKQECLSHKHLQPKEKKLKKKITFSLVQI